jgi:anti-sigma B factor antagonist
LRTNSQVILRRRQNVPVIELVGEFSDAIESELREKYQSASEHGAPDIVLRFDQSTDIRSSGLSMLIGLVSEARAKNQRFHAIGLSKHFAQVFELTGLTGFIQLFASEDEAFEALV